MTNIDLPNDEYAPVVAAVRRVLDEDKFPMSPPPGSAEGGVGALEKFDPAVAPKPVIKRPPLPAAPMLSRVGHRARR